MDTGWTAYGFEVVGTLLDMGVEIQVDADHKVQHYLVVGHLELVGQKESKRLKDDIQDIPGV